MKTFSTWFVTWHCESLFLRDVVTDSADNAWSSVSRGKYGIYYLRTRKKKKKNAQ